MQDASTGCIFHMSIGHLPACDTPTFNGENIWSKEELMGPVGEGNIFSAANLILESRTFQASGIPKHQGRMLQGNASIKLDYGVGTASV